MTTDPNDIELTAELKQQIAELADRVDCDWKQLLQALVTSISRSPDPDRNAFILAQEETLAKVWDNEEDSIFDDM